VLLPAHRAARIGKAIVQRNWQNRWVTTWKKLSALPDEQYWLSCGTGRAVFLMPEEVGLDLAVAWIRCLHCRTQSGQKSRDWRRYDSEMVTKRD
jgi:hypothetical protein